MRSSAVRTAALLLVSSTGTWAYVAPLDARRCFTPAISVRSCRCAQGGAGASARKAPPLLSLRGGSGTRASAATNGGTPPPLRLDREAKLQLSVLMASAFFLQLAVGAIVPVLPLFAQRIGLTANGVGLIVATPALAKLLLNLPIGHLADTIGRKPPLILGTLIEAAGSFATAFATTLSDLIPARLLVGAGSAAGTSAGAAYTMDVVGRYPEHTGLLLGTTQAIGLLAFAGGPMLGGLLAERGGVALPFVLIGTVLLASAPLFWLLPETLDRGSDDAATDARTAPSRPQTMREGAAATLASFRTLLSDRMQIGLLLMRAALFAGWSVSLTVVPLHAEATWGATAGQVCTQCARGPAPPSVERPVLAPSPPTPSTSPPPLPPPPPPPTSASLTHPPIPSASHLPHPPQTPHWLSRVRTFCRSSDGCTLW